MRRAHLPDALAGATLVGLALATFLLVRSFPPGPPDLPGPGMFPLLMAALGAVLGLVLMVAALRRREPGTASPVDADSPRWRIPAVLAGTVAYVLLMPVLGFVSASVLYLTGLILILGYPHKARAAAVAFIVAWAIQGIFAGVMNVPLPAGWLG